MRPRLPVILLLLAVNLYFILAIAYYIGFLPRQAVAPLVVAGLVLVAAGGILKLKRRK